MAFSWVIPAAAVATLALTLVACDRGGSVDDGPDAAVETGTSLGNPPPSDGGDATAAGELDAIFHTCAIAASCPGTQSSFVTVDACTKTMVTAKALLTPVDPPVFGLLGPDELVACAASVTSCSAWLACANAPYGPSYCANHPGASCDGNTAVSCSGAASGGTSTVCAPGYPCTIVGSSAICTNGVSCTPPQYQADPGCENGVLTDCTGAGITTGVECGPTASCGATGELPGPVVAACVPNAPLSLSCYQSPTCDGTTAVDCSLSYDCAAVGMACDPTGSRYFADCAPTAPQCADDVADPTCLGNAMRWCLAGQWRTFDCSSIGLSCDDTEGPPANCQ